MRRALIYLLLIAGGLIFAWPFVWLVATSLKTERELFSSRSALLPEAPRPRDKSPYLANTTPPELRALCLSELRAQSTDLQTQELFRAGKDVGRWNAGRAATLVAEGSCLRVEYNFRSDKLITVSETFTTTFPVSHLRRLQLYFRPDGSWNALRVKVEKLGQTLNAERAVYLADYNWQTVTWQEEGNNEELTRMKTWNLLKPDGPSNIRRENELKITFELDRSSMLQAWLAKLSGNYELTLDYIPFFRYVATSFFLVFLNVIGALFSCSFVAYAFARLHWPGRSIAFAILLGTMMIPPQVTMIPQFLIMQKLGWYNTLKPLWVLSFFGSAFSIFLLRQSLKNLPRDLEDAARIDGCGYLRIYWHIVLPLIRPTLAVVAIFTFLYSWNDFMGPLIYLSDQRLYPLSFGLYAFQVQSLQPGTSAGIGMLMAASLLMMLPVALIFFFAQRYFLQGIALTGIKR